MTDWDGIVQNHGPAVWRTAYRILGNHADAEDCFQETFSALVQFTQRRDEPVRHWNALLVRLATAKAVDRLRQRIRRSSREVPGVDHNELPDHSIQTRPPDRAEQAEFSARLRLVLAHLPPKQADVFCLHCLEGWSYREVAEHLSTTTDDVGVLLHRARAALRERVASILSREDISGAKSQTQTNSTPLAKEVRHEEQP